MKAYQQTLLEILGKYLAPYDAKKSTQVSPSQGQNKTLTCSWAPHVSCFSCSSKERGCLASLSLIIMMMIIVMMITRMIMMMRMMQVEWEKRRRKAFLSSPLDERVVQCPPNMPVICQSTFHPIFTTSVHPYCQWRVILANNLHREQRTETEITKAGEKRKTEITKQKTKINTKNRNQKTKKQQRKQKLKTKTNTKNEITEQKLKTKIKNRRKKTANTSRKQRNNTKAENNNKRQKLKQKTNLPRGTTDPGYWL